MNTRRLRASARQHQITEHLMYSILVLTCLMFAVLTLAYIAQYNEATAPRNTHQESQP